MLLTSCPCQGCSTTLARLTSPRRKAQKEPTKGSGLNRFFSAKEQLTLPCTVLATSRMPACTMSCGPTGSRCTCLLVVTLQKMTGSTCFSFIKTGASLLLSCPSDLLSVLNMDPSSLFPRVCLMTRSNWLYGVTNTTVASCQRESKASLITSPSLEAQLPRVWLLEKHCQSTLSTKHCDTDG